MVGHDFLGRTRKHRLAAVGQVAQPCCSVNGRSEVVAFVTQLDLAGVQTDPKPDRRQRCQLQVEGARHRVTTAVERDDKAVTFTLLDGPHTSVGGDDVRECAIEPCDRLRHLLGLGLPEPRRPFDVGEWQPSPFRSVARSPLHRSRFPAAWSRARVNRAHVNQHRARQPHNIRETAQIAVPWLLFSPRSGRFSSVAAPDSRRADKTRGNR